MNKKCINKLIHLKKPCMYRLHFMLQMSVIPLNGITPILIKNSNISGTVTRKCLQNSHTSAFAVISSVLSASGAAIPAPFSL